MQQSPSALDADSGPDSQPSAAETQAPAHPPRPLRALLAWAVAALWALFIWGLGTEGFSMTSTSRFLGPLLEWLAPGLSAARSYDLMVSIRALAHACEYGVFALLVLRALRLVAPHPWIRAGGIALLAVLVLAIADEIRQASSPTRTGSPVHVGFDLAGGSLALAGAFARTRWPGRGARERA